ncbi:MAG: surface-adhesin E family protein, partial [Nitrospirales bacterium]
MTRLLLMTILILSSGPVYAEWVSVGRNVEEGLTPYTVYVDLDTIRRDGDVVKLWALMDFRTIQTEPSPSHLSVKSQREFNCTDEHVRLLALTAFSGHMGSGEAVYS